MIYQCDSEVVKEVGANAAIIYQNIKFWCVKNAANDRHFHDGLHWTYNSMSAFEELFDCFTVKQIRTALEKLESAGYIEVGEYNQNSYDRTKWYADKKVNIDLPKKANGLAQKGEPIPDSKPDNKKPYKKDGIEKDQDLFPGIPSSEQTDPEIEAIESGFEEFWNEVWPKHKRKAQKKDCRDLYVKTCQGKFDKADKISPSTLNRATRAYVAAEQSNQNLKYLKAPLAWLRMPGWEPFLGEGSDISPERQRLQAIIRECEDLT